MSHESARNCAGRAESGGIPRGFLSRTSRNCRSSVFLPGAAGRQGPPPVIPDHELIRCIGRGSYGEVWLARNVMGGFRAVKVIYRGSFDSDRPYEREFSGIQHFEPISRCHESQVDILHVGCNEAAGYFYYIMELADDAACGPQSAAGGGIDPETYEPATLKAMLQRRRRVPFQECLRLALSLTTALGHLHRHGLVHRDVKPSNIVFINGAAKLVDIGLVAGAGATCSFVGTEGYLPLEGPGTPQADLYSLGKVLYEAGIGEDRREFPKWPTTWDCPEEEKQCLELNAVILKACKRDPLERYQTAEQMRADLVLLQAGKSIRRTHQLERRLAVAWRLGMVTTAISILATAGYFWAANQNRLVAKHLELAEAERNRAEESERALKEELRNSLLYQARALRQSGQPGQRFQSLALLAQAAAIRPGPDLRSEAVACMQLMDVRESAWKDSPEGTYGWTFDPAHELYAWSDQQGNFHIRRMSDDFEMAFLPGFGRRAWIAQFSPDSQFFAAKYHPPGRSHPNQFYIWDIERQAKTLEFPGGIYHEAFAFSADGVLAAAGLTEGVIVLVDLVEQREISRFPVEFEPNSLTFSPDGKWLAASSRSGDVYLFDPVSAEVVQKFAHPQRTRGIAWRPDGKLLAAPSDDGFIYLWNTETGRRTSVLAGHEAQVVAACFSQNGRWLASRGWDQAVRIWDVARSKPLLVLSQREFIRNYFSLNDTRFGPFRDGSRLGLWELAGPSDPYRSTGIVVREVTSAALSSDGKRLACSSPSGVSVWDLASGGAVMHWPLNTARAVAFSPEGHLLTAEKGLFLRGGRFRAEAELDWQFEASICLWSSPSAVCDDVALSQCGRKIAVSNGRDEAVVIDREQGREPLFLSGHADVRFVTISPGGEWVATGTEHGKDVGIWETQSGRLLKLLPVMGGARVAFSPDGGWLVINTREGCSFVESGSWQVRHQLRMDAPADEGWLGRIVFSPDGLLLAVSRSRKIIQLFEGRSGEFLMNLETLVHAPVGFTEGGESLLVYGQHGEFFFWDMLLIRRQLAEIGLDWEARADRAMEFAIIER